MSTSSRPASRSSCPSPLDPISYDIDNGQGTIPTPRQTPGRKDTDVILSYYQSEDAGQAYTAQHAQSLSIKPPVYRRRMSTASSPSEYSPDTDEDADSTVFFQSAAAQKPNASSQRPNTPSEEGADKRRATLVDVGSGKSDQGLDSTRSKRGADRLALVVPLDASPETCTNLTPPPTATIAAEKAYLQQAATKGHTSAGHHRWASEEATGSSTGTKLRHGRKNSRNIGIVGTSGDSVTVGQSQRQDPLKPPIFQMPQSRSPSPRATSAFSDSHASLHRGRSLKEEFVSTMSVLSPEEVATPGGENDQAAVSPSTPRPHKTLRRKASPEATVSASPYPSPPFSPDLPSSYLHYQPGVHAIAGPLPSPPRATLAPGPAPSPPPRPPRTNSPSLAASRRRGDVNSVKQALQLPDSSLKSQTSNASFRDLHSISSKSNLSEVIYPQSSPKSAVSAELPPVTMSAHVREGAFSLSSESESAIVQSPKSSMDDLAAVVDDASDDAGLPKANEGPLPTVVEPPRSSEDSDVHSGGQCEKGEGWISVTPEDVPRVVTPASDDGTSTTSSGHINMNILKRSLSRSRSPTKPAKEIADDTSPSTAPRHVRSTLSVSLKRFSSLPRAPSLWSEKRLSTGSRSSNGSSLSTLPPPSEVPELPRTPPPTRKIISPWPAAMSCADVVSKKTALERSLGYAAKINELYIHDCGLTEFLLETQYRGNARSKRATLVPGPRGSSTAPNSFQPRHVSRSSMTSEVTFPRRADTTTATDLAYRNKGDVSPPLGPPPLPYPSLAQSTPPATSRISTTTSSLSSSSSAQTMASPTSSGKSSSGFFSSLGRKASMKKERGAALSSQPSTKLQKTPSSKAPSNPRPVNIPSVPTVPGGPRAAPNRLARSQTIMLPKSPPSSAASNRNNSINRRPSLFTARRQSSEGAVAADETVINIEQDPEFVSQVSKLSVLLPHADKEVLSAYLRRAGSDLIAIGQYLEDERNGTIRRD